MSFTNKREISCFGLRRSGNHGILNWITSQDNDPYVHLNAVRLNIDKDPYKGYGEVFISGINPFIYHKQNFKFRPRPFLGSLRYLMNPEVKFSYGCDRDEVDREALRKYKVKPLVIHSYEHYSFSEVMGSWFEEKREDFLGKSQDRFDLLILRDPYNTFASLIKRGEVIEEAEPIINKWIEYAKEYLGLSNYLKNRISVNYNEWFQNKTYREEMARSLGLVFSDAGIDTIPRIGRKGKRKGSSFDGLNYQGQATKMGVLSRYEEFLDHPAMLKVLANKELNELSTEIFGSIL